MTANPKADLRLSVLREANIRRSHSAVYNTPIDSWSESEWACACAGEVGELCNLITKRRANQVIDPQWVADEIADCVIYLDLLAARMRINLAEAIVRKFNATSTRVGSTHNLSLEDADGV